MRAVLLRVTAENRVSESDTALLERFAAERDEEAFAELVRRHGPMVLGVCRRVLRNASDAEDTFQATFLLLALKARSPAESVAGWLHGTARRVALNSRKARMRRSKHERAAASDEATVAPTALSDLRTVLDEELARLPESFRASFVLCCLEGRTRPEAAAALRCTEGTMSSRLARARQILRDRLTRRGICPPTTLTAVALSEGVASAVVSSALVDSTTRIAVLLAAAGRSTDVVPPAVAALLKGITPMPGKMTIAFAGLVLVAALGTVGVGASARPAPPDPAQALPPPAAGLPAARRPAEPLKKLGRLPDPPPALRLALAAWDGVYRHAPEEKFLELEREAAVLLAKYPDPDNQARIYFEVAHVAGQSGTGKHYARIESYARRALARSRDPVQRGWLYMYLSCTAQSEKAAPTFAARRRLAADLLLTNLRELQAQELPEKVPERPLVGRAVRAPDMEESPEEHARRVAEMEAYLDARFVEDLISRRETAMTQLRDLYRPSVYQSGRDAAGPDELRLLAAKKLGAPAVEALMARVIGPGKSEPAVSESWRVNKTIEDLVQVTMGTGHGLKVGDTLDVFRPGLRPAYVGRLRLVAVDATEVIGQVSGQPKTPVEFGDVAVRVLPSR